MKDLGLPPRSMREHVSEFWNLAMRGIGQPLAAAFASAGL